MGMEVEFCPALGTFSQHFPTTDLPVPSALSLDLADIRGGVCDHGEECFLYEMDVITKVLNPWCG